MFRCYVSCAPPQPCRTPSVRSGTRTCTPLDSVPVRFRSAHRLSRSLLSYSTRDSVNLSCIFKQRVP
ncbi:hypothetical protein WJX77_000009 [Trebouxia sp. C0004]